MGILAIDIETASPYGEPDDFTNTEWFEVVCAGLAYWETTESEVDSTVIFRDGGWDDEHTATFLRELVSWVDDRDVETVLTYNGERFDANHLLKWTDTCFEKGLITTVERNTLDNWFSDAHIDLMIPAHDEYGRRPKFETVCRDYGIQLQATRYDDYEIPEGLVVETPTVENWHIGTKLGEQYVTWVVEDAEGIHFDELERLLREYTIADIEPQLELARELDALP